MTRTIPDRSSVKSALALAVRAPSVHNTQPWRWEIGDRTVHLFADWSRQVHATDPDGRDLIVSCGAALHHLRIALATLGWATTVHRIPNPALPSHLAAVEMHPRQPTDEQVALAAAIGRRRTDRRHLSSWTVPTGHIDLMIEQAAHAGALLVPLVDPHSRHLLIRAIAEAAARQNSSPEYVRELAAWSARSTVSEDGVLATSTPLIGSPAGILLREFPGGVLPQPGIDPWDEEGSVVLALATTGDDPLSRLRAGEAASAALLTATDLGLATTPLSQALEIADTRTAIADDVLGGAAVPQLLLRVGWAPTSAPPLPASPRRPLDDVVSVVPRAYEWESQR